LENQKVSFFFNKVDETCRIQTWRYFIKTKSLRSKFKKKILRGLMSEKYLEERKTLTTN
jgi:hypothetical protein